MSFSGGKDSGVLLNLCIDYIRRNNLKRKIGVFHMDYEVQYKMTIDFVDSILEKNKDLLDVYRICLPFRVATSTSMYQSFWRPWDEEKKDLWVRQMPEGAMTIKDFPELKPDTWDYDFQLYFAQWLHKKKKLHVLAVWWVYGHRKASVAGDVYSKFLRTFCIISISGPQK